MVFGWWGRKKRKSLDDMKPDKKGFVEKDIVYLMQRKQFFENESCLGATVDMVDMLLGYMAEKGMRKIKLRANHYLINNKEFCRLRNKGKI